MAGSTPFSIEENCPPFKRSLKKLHKVHGQALLERIEDFLEKLIDDQCPLGSHWEPLPSDIALPKGLVFYKFEFKLSKGASGQIRLIYLVDKDLCRIYPLWVYSHEQFTKRPPDGDLRKVIREILDN